MVRKYYQPCGNLFDDPNRYEVCVGDITKFGKVINITFYPNERRKIIIKPIIEDNMKQKKCKRSSKKMGKTGKTEKSRPMPKKGEQIKGGIYKQQP